MKKIAAINRPNELFKSKKMFGMDSGNSYSLSLAFAPDSTNWH